MPASDRRPTPVVPRLLDIAGLADCLGTSERHVRGLIAERRIPYVKVGAFVRFDPAEIAAWLDLNRQKVRASG